VLASAIIGKRWSTTQTALLTLDCRPCDTSTSYGLYRTTTRVIVFVPLFALSHDDYLRCEKCWSSYDITPQDAAWLTDPTTDLSGYQPRTTRRAAPGGHF
jgi:hypothetical protein